MTDHTSRRQWLKTTATAVTGLGLSPVLFAAEREKYRAAGIIILNSNENAYGPSAAARKALSAAAAISNRYPDDAVALLKKQIADFYKTGTENILLGAGSSEIIGLVALLVSTGKGNIVTADPAYRVWNDQATAMGFQFKRVPLANDKTHDLAGMLSATDENTRLMYVCNPNNPVGTYAEDHLLRAFVTECSKKCMVFIDEAYTEYADLRSLNDMAVKNKNIIVAKTFSKIYGLAGARVGFAIAHPETINRLGAYQPWPDANVSTASAAAASAALSDQPFVKECREKTKQARELCFKTFNELQLEFIPSHTNFILFNIGKIGTDFTMKMQAKNIYVQYRDHFGGKWCRVSMGTIEEMEMFCKALKEIA
jgi:histidinol-phosphate aminotransferase